jgi:Fe-S-cluster-containing hydrogenase component 2
MCSIVCPHGVFAQPGDVAVLERCEECMECGACSLNCPTGAITVDSGVGCAQALMLAALTGRGDDEACCGPRDRGPADERVTGEACCDGPDRTPRDGGRSGRGGSCCC